MPKINPTDFLFVNFSLNTNAEPIQTKIIPKPLKSGKRITEGTFPASPVITMLIIQSETALAIAHNNIAYPFFRVSVCERIKADKIRKAVTNE